MGDGGYVDIEALAQEGINLERILATYDPTRLRILLRTLDRETFYRHLKDPDYLDWIWKCKTLESFKTVLEEIFENDLREAKITSKNYTLTKVSYLRGSVKCRSLNEEGLKIFKYIADINSREYLFGEFIEETLHFSTGEPFIYAFQIMPKLCFVMDGPHKIQEGRIWYVRKILFDLLPNNPGHENPFIVEDIIKCLHRYISEYLLKYGEELDEKEKMVCVDEQAQWFLLLVSRYVDGEKMTHAGKIVFAVLANEGIELESIEPLSHMIETLRNSRLFNAYLKLEVLSARKMMNVNRKRELETLYKCLRKLKVSLPWEIQIMIAEKLQDSCYGVYKTETKSPRADIYCW